MNVLFCCLNEYVVGVVPGREKNRIQSFVSNTIVLATIPHKQ